MRISDWSSDVCSSDLASSLTLQRHARNFPAFRPIRRHGSRQGAAASTWKTYKSALCRAAKLLLADPLRKAHLSGTHPGRRQSMIDEIDRKSTRLNSSH